MRNLRPCAGATLVGSMPHKDREKVIELILRDMPEFPAWPQLTSFPAEQMMFQYLEGMPGMCSESGRTFFRTDTARFDEEMLAFYEEYLEVEAGTKDLDHSIFRMGPETGKTFFDFLERLGRAPSPAQAVKGQIVGPFTLLSGLKDQQDRALLYDERLQDMFAKHLAMKAKWQVQKLQAPGLPVIIFLDEPALAGFGSSAFISVTKELVLSLLKEVVDAIHRANGLAGIHICANTDWLLAFESDVDIINFDAYHYFDRFALYKEPFAKYMKEGRIVAWGMVPTSDETVLFEETPQSLAEKWREQIQDLATPELPVGKILSQSLFSPSCGCGSLKEAASERVIELTRHLSEIMKADCKSAERA